VPVRYAVLLALGVALASSLPAAAEGESIVLASLSSGVYVEIADPADVSRITEILSSNNTWTKVPDPSPFRETHLLDFGVSSYTYAAGTGAYAGAALWFDRDTERFLIDEELNTILQPYLDRLAGLEGEVAFAKTLQIIAGVALAILVGALFAIGMREERRPQVLR